MWHAGERAAAFIAPGQHYCPTGPSGVIGDYLFWTDENSLVHVWDVQHGLYVDTLLEDCSRGPLPSPYTVWVELFNSRVFRHPRTGKVYLLAASDAIHVFEVLGTQQRPVRFQGEFNVTQAELDAARRGSASRSARRQRMLLVRRARGPVSIDGDLSEFAAAPAAEMVLNERARGTARLLYDDRYLYLAFDVQDDSPWRNAGERPDDAVQDRRCDRLVARPVGRAAGAAPKDVRRATGPARRPHHRGGLPAQGPDRPQAGAVPLARGRGLDGSRRGARRGAGCRADRARRLPLESGHPPAPWSAWKAAWRGSGWTSRSTSATLPVSATSPASTGAATARPSSTTCPARPGWSRKPGAWACWRNNSSTGVLIHPDGDSSCATASQKQC